MVTRHDGNHAAAVPRAGKAPHPQSDDMVARRTRQIVGLTCLAVVIARLLHAGLPLRSDEGGYLLIARQWAPGAGEFLYGDYHVDRPPVLMLFFRWAALWESDAAIRVIAVPVVVVTVLTIAGSGWLMGGHLAARWSAVVTGALLCSPALAGDQADGELFAVPFVAGSVLMALQASHARTTSTASTYMFAAGVLGASASLIKQNFVDGIVFLGVLLLARAGQEGRISARTLRTGGAALAGTATAYGLALGWLFSWGVDLSQARIEVVSFRSDALEVILESSLQAPARRAATLLGLAIVSLALPIALLWGRWLRHRPGRLGPDQWAVVAMLSCGLAGVALGGSYWPHYLVQLVPAVALAAGTVIADGGSAARRMRWLARSAVASTTITTAGAVTIYAMVPSSSFPQHIGRWLADSSHSGDTVFVAYGNPHILEHANLGSPYPYLWSLQMRTLDPHQHRLRETLRGRDAPAWVVQTTPLNSWDIDRARALRTLLDHRYRRVAEVCGFPVLLHVGVERDLAEVPDCETGTRRDW